MFNVAVFASGRGSNLRVLFEKISPENIKICAVISDKKDCGAVEFAEQNSIPVFFVSSMHKDGFNSYNYVAQELKKMFVDLIVLTGFLKKIPDEFIDEFEKKIINIHPALLPSYGGKGMYGMNVHRAVFNAKEKFSGATVHIVDKIYDNGEIIAQRSVEISKLTSPEEIAVEVLKIEHELLPEVVLNFSKSSIKIN
ncbi:MAG: phosphoribosylglycinamide formyltransferase [Ignavibacteria bacterium]|nr:MAG: phosphoribosylglycinamide formyltransferase [Ignavibacteria bacterium]KAF0161377.1 MAG: phosphoribosylglycinamide formyltransferase [Ignavibacteria bacterium]